MTTQNERTSSRMWKERWRESLKWRWLLFFSHQLWSYAEIHEEAWRNSGSCLNFLTLDFLWWITDKYDKSLSALENALEIALARAESVFKFTKYEQLKKSHQPRTRRSNPLLYIHASDKKRDPVRIRFCNNWAGWHESRTLKGCAQSSPSLTRLLDIAVYHENRHKTRTHSRQHSLDEMQFPATDGHFVRDLKRCKRWGRRRIFCNCLTWNMCTYCTLRIMYVVMRKFALKARYCSD